MGMFSYKVLMEFWMKQLNPIYYEKNNVFSNTVI